MLSSWSRLIWTLSDLNHCSSEVCDGGVKSQRSKLGMDQEDIATPTNHANIVQDNDEVEEVVEYWVLMNYTIIGEVSNIVPDDDFVDEVEKF